MAKKNKEPSEKIVKEKKAEKTKAGKTKAGKIGGLNTSYLTKMGLRNLVANRTMSLSSISVLTACLLLIGVSFVLLFNMKTLVRDVENQNVVVAFLKDKVDTAGIMQTQHELEMIPNVGVAEDGTPIENAVTFVSKEEAFNQQLNEFGVEREALEGVIENPLPDSFRITVSNIEEFDATLAKIKAVSNVDTVRESQEIVKQITTMQKSITMICLILVVALVVVSLFIIINTIRITMVSRKIDIQVMKSVGATNAFISWPFMIEGVFIGLFSGIIALGLTYLLEMGEGNALNSLFGLFGSSVVSITDFLPYFIGGYILAGMLLGAFGSVVSLMRYLKKEGSESELNL